MGIEFDGKNPQGYMGVNPTKRPETVRAQRAPTSGDRRWKLGTCWIDESADSVWFLTKVAAGVATWNLTSTGTSDVDTINSLSPIAGDILIDGGTNITDSNAGNTVTINLDDAITLATSVTSPLYTAGAGVDLDLTVPAGQDAVLKLGDAAGANQLNITDSADVSIGTFDSDGNFTLLAGDFVESRSAASLEVLNQLTNSDNTAADSDAFFEVAVGGTSSGNPGVRFQISGGQNYSVGIDNASAADDFLICGDNDIGTDPLIRVEELGDVTIEKGNLIIGAVAKQLQMNGGAVTDFIGVGTLVAGTVTIANTNIAAGDRILVTRSALNASPALGHLITTISAATSFTVASYDATGSAATTDVSSFDYVIVRQN